METPERPTLGERVASRLERLSSRERRRPRLAFSPTLYARLGVEDPWAVAGLPGSEGEAADGFVFLSAQPYYAMLRRLAAARRRRERRLERFGGPRLGEGRIASVAVPAAGLSLVPSRIARLAAGDWIFPTPPAPVAAPVAAAPDGVAAPAPRVDGFVPARKGGWAGWTAPSSRPAGAVSVAGGSESSAWGGGGGPLRNASPSASSDAPSRGEASPRPVPAGRAARPLDRIARGAPHGALPAPLAAALEEAIATVAPARRALVRRVEESIALLPVEEQVVAVRRLVRVLGVRARAAQDEIAVMAAEPAARAVASRATAPRATVSPSPRGTAAAQPPAAPPRFAAPVGEGEDTSAGGASASRSAARVPAVVRAVHRMEDEARVATGLRPVLRRSPAMALAASADTDRASAGTLAEAERTENAPASTSVARPVRAAAVRAAARATAGAPRPGSALPSPITPVAAARVSSLVPRAVVRAAVGDSAGRQGAEAGRAEPGAPAPRGGTTRAAGVPARSDAPDDARGAPSRAGSRSAVRTEATGSSAARAASPGVTDVDTDPEVAAPSNPVRRLPASARAVARAQVVEAAHAATAQDRDVLGLVALSRADAGSGSAPRVAVRASADGPGVGRTEVDGAPRLRRAVVAPDGVVPQFLPAIAPAVEAAPSSPATEAPVRARPAAWPARRSAATGSDAPAPRVVGTVWAGVRAASEELAPRSVLPARTPRDAARLATGRAAAVAAVPAAAAAETVMAGVARVSARAELQGAVRAVAGPDAAPASTPRASARSASSRVPSAPEMRPLAAAAAPDPALAAEVPPRSEAPQRAASRARAARGAVVAAAERASRMPVTVLADGVAPQAPASGRRIEGPLAFARGARTVGVGRSETAGMVDGRAHVEAARRAGASGRTAAVAPDALVRTPEGRFDSARAAVARGLVVLATAQGLVAAPAAEAASVLDAAGARPPTRRGGAPAGARVRGAERVTVEPSAVRTISARSGRAVPVLVASAGAVDAYEPGGTEAAPGPAPVRPRAVERASARARVEESGAYRGAYRNSRTVRPDAMSAVGVAGGTVPDARGAEGVVAASGDVAAARGAPDAAGSSPTRTARRAAGGGRGVEAGAASRTMGVRAPEQSVVRPAGAAVADDMDAPLEVGTPATRARRGSFDERLAQVASGRTDGATGWVDRAEGSPRLSTVSGLIQALARASSNEDVVRVIAARGDLSSEATRLPLDAPAVQVIQQIRDEVRDEVAAASEPVLIGPSEVRASRLSAPQATALAPQALGSTESTARVVRGRAVRAAATARRAAGAEDRLSRLVRRLQDLIHLAEDQNRLAEARSQVRMAEDSAEARAEGQGPVAGAAADTAKADIEALGRDVLDAVTKELELRRARRMEDGDESPWW